MLDTVFNVFDRNLDMMGSVVTKILDIFEAHGEKKSELLAAWNGMKLEVRFYCSSFLCNAPSTTIYRSDNSSLRSHRLRLALSKLGGRGLLVGVS